MNQKMIELTIIMTFSSIAQKYQDLDIAIKHFNNLHDIEHNSAQKKMLKIFQTLPKDHDIKEIFENNDNLFKTFSELDDELESLTSHRRLFNEAFFIKQVAYLELFFLEFAKMIQKISENPIPPNLNLNHNINIKPLEMCKYISFLTGLNFHENSFFTIYESFRTIRNKLAHGYSVINIDNNQFKKINNIFKNENILVKSKQKGTLMILGDGVIYLSDNITILQKINDMYLKYIQHIFSELISYYRLTNIEITKLINTAK